MPVLMLFDLVTPLRVPVMGKPADGKTGNGNFQILEKDWLEFFHFVRRQEVFQK